ncbi:MAG: lipoyl(octanoyl) transferase LipB [Candidatus Thermoplasmatota archaeon]|jgi:lipoyl(octanoyl) transferase|nr:lipoyl(octanoyl) transferase LipB [Candidatus Thermoplasmatota archaeon]MCL5785404.1 lipoyl(octanoyl) transferase LipB [Candidatus Thermoplasmatota archaeon]
MESHFTSRLAVDLGTIPYEECLELQRALVRLRADERIPDAVLFVDHPPVYTIGRKADPSNFPGISPVKVERGGDVTYHGPGQLVVYPIFRLWDNGKVDVRELVRIITGAVIEFLHDNGYAAYIGEEPGIWISGKKVASVGMAVDSGVTFHGAAINLAPGVLTGFRKIRPCGLSSEVMSFVPVRRDKAITDLIAAFSRRFGPFTILRADQDSLPIDQILSSIPNLLLETSE